jgi:hypothetical protein
VELLVDLFRDRCCKCCESFPLPSPPARHRRPWSARGGSGSGGGSSSSNSVASPNDDASSNSSNSSNSSSSSSSGGGGGLDPDLEAVVVAVDCGFTHRAHHRCLRAHVVEAIRLRHYPISCPAADLCKCTVTERGVRDLLLLGSGGGGGGGDDDNDDNGGDSDANDNAEGYLTRYYELAYEHARSINGLQRPCPNQACGAMVPIRAATSSRTAAAALHTFGVQCSACRQQWCPVRVGE